MVNSFYVVIVQGEAKSGGNITIVASNNVMQIKKGDAHLLFQVGGTLVSGPQFPAEVKVVGYTILTDLVSAAKTIFKSN